MSLKTLHIVFISSSIALSFFVGGWLLNDYRSSRDVVEIPLAIVSVAGGVLLIAYAKAILRKLRQISYL